MFAPPGVAEDVETEANVWLKRDFRISRHFSSCGNPLSTWSLSPPALADVREPTDVAEVFNSSERVAHAF